MYLISLYFDEKTNKKIMLLADNIARASGNTYMRDKEIPPHITLMAFESRLAKESIIDLLEKIILTQQSGELHWVTIGAFLPHVLYVGPVLNTYLQKMIEGVYSVCDGQPDTEIQVCYRPYSWVPHTTLAKKLTSEEMRTGFEVLQREFTPFKGRVITVGLSETTSKREIASWDLVC